MSVYNSDDAAIYEAYNYSSKRKEDLEEDMKKKEENGSKENRKENSMAAPQATNGIYPEILLPNYGYGFNYPPGSVPLDIRLFPSYDYGCISMIFLSSKEDPPTKLKPNICVGSCETTPTLEYPLWATEMVPS